MANDEHIALLKKGVAVWNAWREEHPEIPPDLSGAGVSGLYLVSANLKEAYLFRADLSETNLLGADLTEANLSNASLTGAQISEANLSKAILRNAFMMGVTGLRVNLADADLGSASLDKASLIRANLTRAKLGRACLSEASLLQVDLRGADLSQAVLVGADLRGANLSEALLSKANLQGANFSGANLSRANLSSANLQTSILVETDLTDADLTGCRIYGVSAWAQKMERAKQENLVITPESEPQITVDNIEVAQFVYLLLHNEKIRHVIDTITSKTVLILGRFTPERKAVLDALREELRKHDYVPVLFDFDVPANRDITETVSLLARMARFIVADLTDPSSIPKELEAIVPGLTVPVQPLLEGSSRPYSMFRDHWKYPWVLPIYWYDGLDTLLAALAEKVISPAGKRRQKPWPSNGASSKPN